MPKFWFVVLLTLLVISACSFFGRQLPTHDIGVNVLFIPIFGFKDPTEANNAVHQFMAESLWSKLKVVKQGKFHVISGFYWQGSSYISANRVLDDLFTYILHPLEETRSKRIKRAKA